MLDLTQTSETIGNYHLRAWTGVATDEGVGLISTVEVSDHRGVPVCRFEEFLDASLQRTGGAWPRDEDAACQMLQERAIERARTAVLASQFGDVHGHRFDVAR